MSFQSRVTSHESRIVGVWNVVARMTVTLIGLASSSAFAQEKLFAAPPATTNAAPSGAGSMAQATVALMLVLVAVFAAAYGLKRLRKFSAASGAQGIEVVSQAALGSKERAVLLKVAGAHVLVGVAPGQVNLLHVLDANAIPPTVTAAASTMESAVSPSAPTFKSLLKKSLGMQ
jgi:flagellar protein FliO/FliZ